MQLSLQPGGQGEGKGTEEGEDGEGDGHAGTKRDPFGRQVDGSGAVGDDPQLRVPEEMEQGPQPRHPGGAAPPRGRPGAAEE